MSIAPQQLVPVSIDLQSLVRHSVASLYSHLVTRPTGRALRFGIESQIVELGACCISVLDFRQVVVLDYSCADEAVAKLIQRYLADDRPADAYFVAVGLGEHHRDPIESVLDRHRLALVADIADGGYELLGQVDTLERDAWSALQRAQVASAERIATELGQPLADTERALHALALRRTVLPKPGTSLFCSLTALL